MAYVNTVTILPPYLHIASGLSSNSFTFTLWVKALSYGILGLKPSAAYALVGPFNSVLDGLGIEDGGGNLLSAGNVITGGLQELNFIFGTSFSNWQFVAFSVDSGGNWITYIGNESSPPSQLVSSIGLNTVTDLYISSPFSVGLANAKYTSIKFFTRNLNATEILAEYNNRDPVNTVDIYTFLSGNNGSTIGSDESGNGNNWTQIHSGFTTDTDMPNFPGPFSSFWLGV